MRSSSASIAALVSALGASSGRSSTHWSIPSSSETPTAPRAFAALLEDGCTTLVIATAFGVGGSSIVKMCWPSHSFFAASAGATDGAPASPGALFSRAPRAPRAARGARPKMATVCAVSPSPVGPSLAIATARGSSRRTRTRRSPAVGSVTEVIALA